jgi:plasmid stabilization system protein ParE
MPNILRTHESRRDIIEILLPIRRDNRRAAYRLLNAINDTLELLAASPALWAAVVNA